MTKPKTYTPSEEWFIKQLRKVSTDWPPKEQCLNAARVGPDKYKCAHCEQVFKGRYSLKVDHIYPVVDPTVGWQGKGTYAERLFCDEAGLQALCAPCHQLKTNEENTIRRAASKARLAARADPPPEH